MSQKLIVNVTGAATGFGALAARALAKQGHTVFAGLRTMSDKSLSDIDSFNNENKTDLRPLKQDMLSDDSVNESVKEMVSQAGKVDVIVHNCGHMVTGPLEGFTPDQLAAQYDINTLSTQRLNRAILPRMRERRKGLLVWVSSSSVIGATPPFIAPYFAAKAGMDALATSYAFELSPFGIESVIVTPGAFSSGTNHFLDAGKPADGKVVEAYRSQDSPSHGLEEAFAEGWAKFERPGQSIAVVSDKIAEIVSMKHGTRPKRVFIDPADDGSEQLGLLRDKMRRDKLALLGLEYLYTVKGA